MIDQPIPTRVWQGIETIDPPAFVRDHARLLKMAEAMLQSRRERFPGDIAAGRLTAEAAQLELTAFEWLVQNWRFIALGEGEPAGYGADHILRDALDEALQRIASFAAEQGGFTQSLSARAQAVIALRWHLEPGRQTIALARLNHRWRAEARANSSKEPAQ